MHSLTISAAVQMPYSSRRVEIVERKGIGHPDTICDAIAEELSRALSQYYLEKFGLVMHHNVDKALLWGGSSIPAYGGGSITAPMEIFLAGRATCEFRGVKVPLARMVEESCSNWIRSHFHMLDPEKHVKIHSLIRPGSSELIDLFLRQEKTGIALANDTSCGVGYAPLSELEKIVLQTEKHLNDSYVKSVHPEIGEDIKIMGVRRGNNVELTIACAFIDRYISNVNDYVAKKELIARLAKQEARKISSLPINVKVNGADDIGKESLYLTVTGTSAESGDDGEVGRGNRVNGIITPYRPMNMEAAAGKNPVTHVGKLYNIIAQQIAASLVDEIEVIQEAYCYIVSRIGSPVYKPQIIDLQLFLADRTPIKSIKPRLEEIVEDKLSNNLKIQQDLISGLLRIY